jgi:hypothetical protein
LKTHPPNQQRLLRTNRAAKIEDQCLTNARITAKIQKRIGSKSLSVFRWVTGRLVGIFS